MSEAIQRRAREYREAALARAEAARERAESSRGRGHPAVARRLEESAQHQEACAAAAERLLVAAVAIEGKLAGEPNGYGSPRPAFVPDASARVSPARQRRAGSG